MGRCNSEWPINKTTARQINEVLSGYCSHKEVSGLGLEPRKFYSLKTSMRIISNKVITKSLIILGIVEQLERKIEKHVK